MKFIQDLKDKYEESKKMQIAVQVFFFALAIASIVTAVEAFRLLKMAYGDVNSILDNWKTVPITDYEVIGYNESCSAGFSLLNMQPDYPGSKPGGCACTQGATYQNESVYSSYSSCEDNQKQPNCYQDPSLPPVSLTSYHGSKLCVKREGEPLVSWEHGYEARPNPKRVVSGGQTVSYRCPTGYQVCGEGTLDANRSICFPTTSPCPLTSLEESATALPSKNKSLAFKAPNSGYMVAGREEAMKLPIVDLHFALVGGSRGVCYGTDRRLQTEYDGRGRWSTPDAYQSSYPDSCDRSDTRYEVISSWDEGDFLEHNFWKQSECANVTSNPNYQETGIVCSSSSYTCEMTTDSSFACDSSDNICLSLTSQTECGKFMEAARSVSGTWGLHARTQIYWKEDCEKDFDVIKENRGPLQQAVGTQYTLLVINCVANGFAIFIAVTLILNLSGMDVPWIPFDKEREREIVKKMKEKIVPILRIAKIVPLFIGVMIMVRIRFFFAALGKVDCSDSLTNYTFRFLGEQIPKVFLMNLITLILEGIQLIVPVFLLIRNRCFNKEDLSKVQPEEETEEETELVRLAARREGDSPVPREGHVLSVERGENTSPGLLVLPRRD